MLIQELLDNSTKFLGILHINLIFYDDANFHILYIMTHYGCHSQIAHS